MESEPIGEGDKPGPLAPVVLAPVIFQLAFLPFAFGPVRQDGRPVQAADPASDHAAFARHQLSGCRFAM